MSPEHGQDGFSIDKVGRPVQTKDMTYSRRAMCDIRRHEPGSRVTWLDRDRETREWRHATGTVRRHYAHNGMDIERDDTGEVVRVLCSHV